MYGTNAILEFIDIAPLPTSDNLISTLEHKAMARDEDKMTAATTLCNDDVSDISGGSNNTISLKAKYKAALETSAIQAQCIKDLEKEKTQATNTTATPKRSKKITKNISPEEKAEEEYRVEEDEEENLKTLLHSIQRRHMREMRMVPLNSVVMRRVQLKKKRRRKRTMTKRRKRILKKRR